MVGGVMALGAKTLTDGFDAMSTAFTETYDTALDLYKTMGLTAGEAAGVTNSIQTAGMFSLTKQVHKSRQPLQRT